MATMAPAELEDATHDEVLHTVRRVLAGETLLTPDVASRLLKRLVDEQRQDLHEVRRHLTSRELTVLRLVANGATNREIASALHLSAGTVKVHVERILAKLGVAHRTQAAVRAIELGIAPAATMLVGAPTSVGRPDVEYQPHSICAHLPPGRWRQNGGG